MYVIERQNGLRVTHALMKELPKINMIVVNFEYPEERLQPFCIFALPLYPRRHMQL